MNQQTFADRKTSVDIRMSQPSERELDAPAPSYPQNQYQAPNNIQAPPSYDKTVYPPTPHHKQTPSFTLHVWYESYLKNDVHILDADSANTLYTLKLAVRKPQMVFDSTATNATIATVQFDFTSRTIGAEVNGSSIPLISRGLLKNGHTWTSAALGNVKFTWKIKGFNLVCEDERGIPVASITFPSLSLRKAARLDMNGPEMARAAVMEEILVTGLASVEYNAGLTNVSIVS